MPASRCWARSTASRCARSRACAVRTARRIRVQTAMAEADATQCGFCTPGFVMSAYAFAAGGEKPDPETIHDALAGNLCRCTGYRPIVERHDRRSPACRSNRRRRAPARAESATFGGVFHRAALARRAPGAARAASRARSLLAGATDLGLLASRSRKPPAAVIHVAHVPELTAIARDKEEITIGAAATYAEAMPAADRRLSGAEDLSRAAGLAADPQPWARSAAISARPRRSATCRRCCWRSRRDSSSSRRAARASCRWRTSSSATARRRWRADEVIQSLTLPQAVAGRGVLLRQAQQAARPGHLHRGGRLSPAHQERQDRGRAHRLRRHGGDAQARRPCRAGC